MTSYGNIEPVLNLASCHFWAQLRGGVNLGFGRVNYTPLPNSFDLFEIELKLNGKLLHCYWS